MSGKPHTVTKRLWVQKKRTRDDIKQLHTAVMDPPHTNYKKTSIRGDRFQSTLLIFCEAKKLFWQIPCSDLFFSIGNFDLLPPPLAPV